MSNLDKKVASNNSGFQRDTETQIAERHIITHSGQEEFIDMTSIREPLVLKYMSV